MIIRFLFNVQIDGAITTYAANLFHGVKTLEKKILPTSVLENIGFMNIMLILDSKNYFDGKYFDVVGHVCTYCALLH